MFRICFRSWNNKYNFYATLRMWKVRKYVNCHYRTIAMLTPRLRRFLYTHYERCSPSDNPARWEGYSHCRLIIWIERKAGHYDLFCIILTHGRRLTRGSSRFGGRSIASAGQTVTSLWLLELRSGHSMWKTVAKACRIVEHNGALFYHHLGSQQVFI
jgi:hypothetical protein